jgi:D-serine deaminase-like pyridoxal phosphate-dependent protein
VTFAAPGQSLDIGARIECVTPHCDPTINLYDHYHCVRGDTLVDIWPIDARGA